MLPPKYPKSPRSGNHFQNSNPNSTNDIPYPNQQRISNLSREKPNSREKNRFGMVAQSSLDSRSRVSKYQHIRTPQDKRRALGKRRYINQLAYLDYEDKHIQVHTKYTIASKLSAMKKIKAKNQMAQFIQQDQEQQLGFEQLMDFKYGRQSDENFFFQKKQLINEYKYCKQCDCIHNDHPEVHQKVCRQKLMSSDQYDNRSVDYVFHSLKRIETALKRTTGQQYESLKELVRDFIAIEQRSKPSNKQQADGSKVLKSNNNFQKSLGYLNELY